LRAAPLEGRNLGEALEAIAQRIAEEHGLILDFSVNASVRPLPVRVETGLFRIAQEALTNIARHAHAKNVTVKLLVLTNKIKLIVIDDGRGFDPDQVHPDRFGLRGLHERAKLLGGKLKVESSPGCGTRVEASIPA
jgi:signal transduction histidine kinase